MKSILYLLLGLSVVHCAGPVEAPVARGAKGGDFNANTRTVSPTSTKQTANWSSGRAANLATQQVVQTRNGSTISEPISLQGLQGDAQYLVVMFSETWCPYCTQKANSIEQDSRYRAAFSSGKCKLAVVMTSRNSPDNWQNNPVFNENSYIATRGASLMQQFFPEYGSVSYPSMAIVGMDGSLTQKPNNDPTQLSTVLNLCQ